jgi:Tfp pilus assembly protein PilO
MPKAVVIIVLFGSILIALAMVVGSWQLTASRKAKAAMTTDQAYRQLADEYRRLAEMAITAQEHTDLKLADIAVRVDQLRDQLESVQRILADVE